MSAMSDGSRLAAAKPSEIHQKHLDDNEVRSSLRLMLSIVKSSYGPRGYLKMVQNVCGGHVTVTSSSARLFPVVSISQPVLKLIMSAVQTHLRRFKDGGLLASLFSLLLIENSLDMGSVNRTTVCDVFDYLTKYCVDYLTLKNCDLCFELDFSNVGMMLTLLKSVMGTKRGCSLNGVELDHLCQLALETFLKTFREENKGSMFSHFDVLAVEGSSPLQSCLKTGVLFQKQQSEKLGTGLQLKKTECADSSAVKCCLVDISLSGDSDQFLDVVFESDAQSFEEGIVKTILKLCEKFIEDNIGVVFCQKVIHPAIKKYLAGNNVLTIDRLGREPARALIELTGCVPISSLAAKPNSNNYGFVDGIEHTVIKDKHFYHFTTSRSQVSTVVLHGRNEEALSEIQHVFLAGLESLKMAVQKRSMVPGGGCLETCLAKSVREHLLLNESQLMSQFVCSKSQIKTIGSIFTHSLEMVAAALDKSSLHYTDTTTGHHWTAKLLSSSSVDEKMFKNCCCGMVKNDDIFDLEFQEVLLVQSDTLFFPPVHPMEFVATHQFTSDATVIDLLEVKMHALHVAGSTASLVLRVDNFISDTN